jgi:hypothetical protein
MSFVAFVSGQQARAFALAAVIAWQQAGGFCPAAEQAVGNAIKKGVAYLVRTQAGDGTWNTWGSHALGEAALAGLAIVAGGEPIDSPPVAGAAEAVRRLASDNANTYDIALAVMFLDRLGSPADAQLLRLLGGRLLAGQCQDGSWSYGLPANPPAQPSQFKGFGPLGDNSNTQFAALAAWVSRRHGLVNDASLDRLDRHFRTTFDESMSGWPYVGRGGATPTMTCAGLVGLATHRGAKQQQRAAGDYDTQRGVADEVAPKRANAKAADDPIAKRALAALGNELRLADRNPSSTINTDLCFFWSLERVGVIYDVREIGGVDWYQWGSRRLIRGQSPDGQWVGTGSKGWSFDEAIGTSFGILFLARANVAGDLTAQVGSGGGVGEPPPGLGGGSELFRRADATEEPPAIPAPLTAGKRSPRTEVPKKPTPEPGVLDPF